MRSVGTGRLAEKQQARVGGWSGSGECGFLSGIVGRRGNTQSALEIISRWDADWNGDEQGIWSPKED